MASAAIEIRAENGVLHLCAGQIATIDRPFGVTIACTAGAAWVTQGSTTRDFVLYNRDRLVLDRRARVVIEALIDCTLRIEAAEPPASMWARTVMLVQRVSQRRIPAQARAS